MADTPPLAVLFVQSSSDLGGTELMNWRTWRLLRARGVHVDACFLDHAGPVAERYRADGYTPVHLNARRRPPWHTWRDLRRLLAAHPYDIVHLFGLRANVIGRAVARRVGVPCVLSGQRNVDRWRRPWHNWLDRATGRWVDGYVANSHAAARWLADAVGIPPAKIHTVHTGIDAAAWPGGAGGALRAACGVEEGALVLICVANLRRSKAHGVLVTALCRLHARGQPVHLALVGRGTPSAQAALRRQAAAGGVAPFLHLLGPREDVPALLADADMLVLTSDWEGLPGALMEGMAAGLPVVATAVGGVPELVVDGVTGRLVPPQQPDALADAVAALLARPDRGRALGAAGRRRIVEQFDLADRVAELEQLYRALAGRRAAAGEVL